MAQRSPIPQFGNWESGDKVPYTVYFENARKGRTGGKIVNPNDPEENPELAAEYASDGIPASEGRVRSVEQPGPGAAKQAYNGRRSREDGDARQFPASPARYDNTNRRASGDSTPQRYGARGVGPGEGPKYGTRQSAGSEYGLEKSPLNPHARITGKGSSAPSPAREGKISYDSSHGTPGRSRLRGRGDESPEKGAVVPKFGEWSEDNPASADGFTQLFNKVREEKHTGAATGWAPGGSAESAYGNTSRPNPRDNSKRCCCFPWK